MVCFLLVSVLIPTKKEPKHHVEKPSRKSGAHVRHEKTCKEPTMRRLPKVKMRHLTRRSARSPASPGQSPAAAAPRSARRSRSARRHSAPPPRRRPPQAAPQRRGTRGRPANARRALCCFFAQSRGASRFSQKNVNVIGTAPFGAHIGIRA